MTFCRTRPPSAQVGPTPAQLLWGAAAPGAPACHCLCDACRCLAVRRGALASSPHGRLQGTCPSVLPAWPLCLRHAASQLLASVGRRLACRPALDHGVPLAPFRPRQAWSKRRPSRSTRPRCRRVPLPRRWTRSASCSPTSPRGEGPQPLPAARGAALRAAGQLTLRPCLWLVLHPHALLGATGIGSSPHPAPNPPP